MGCTVESSFGITSKAGEMIFVATKLQPSPDSPVRRKRWKFPSGLRLAFGYQLKSGHSLSVQNRPTRLAPPSGKVKQVSAMLKAIHAQEDAKAAKEKALLVVEKLRALRLARAAEIVENGIDEMLWPSVHAITLKWHTSLSVTDLSRCYNLIHSIHSEDVRSSHVRLEK